MKKDITLQWNKKPINFIYQFSKFDTDYFEYEKGDLVIKIKISKNLLVISLYKEETLNPIFSTQHMYNGSNLESSLQNSVNRIYLYLTKLTNMYSEFLN